MKQEVIIPWLDIGIKYAVLIYSVYYLFMRCVSYASVKRDRKKAEYAVFFSAIMGVSMIWLREMIDPMHLPLMLVYITVTNCLIYRNETTGTDGCTKRLTLSEITTLSLLCFAFCEALFMLVGVLSSVVLAVLFCHIVPDVYDSYWAFLNDVPVHIIAYIAMIAMVWIWTYLSARIMKLRRGLMKIVERRSSGTVVMTALLMLTVVIAFGSGGASSNTLYGMKTVLFVPMVLFCMVMIFLTLLEIRADHSMQIRERNLTILEGSLEEKDKKIADLLRDNESLAGIIRRDTELLEILSDGLKRGEDACEINREAEDIERLYAGRCDAVSLLESHGVKAAGTGVNSVDDILRLMACKAEKRGVEFEVDVRSGMEGVIGEKIARREFNTILADLTENAIISAGAVKEKHVEVVLLRNDNNFCLEILDSGDRFDLNVLKNMGKRQITTHSGEGGSGIGLMTLFHILRQTGASFAIEEFSGGEKYNKAVSVTFDGAKRCRIITDRADELRPALRSGIFSIVGR